MTIYSQLAERPGDDIAVKNYGVADIPEGTAVLWDLTNVDPQQPQGIVVPGSGGSMTPQAGITTEVIKAGGIGRLRVNGEKTATAEGSLAVGDWVQVSSTSAKMGRVKALATAGAQLGRCMNSAADGDPVVIEILIAKSG